MEKRLPLALVLSLLFIWFYLGINRPPPTEDGAGEGGPRLLASATREGRPETYPWPAAPRDTARLAVSWTGAGAPAAGYPVWLEVWEMRVSCALDIADHGGMRLEDVGELMNVTRERARQIEIQALAKLELGERQVSLRDYFE